MAFRRRNVERDPLEDLGSDLSDVSDVKPEDLDKILKSANDLDDEIFKITPKASATELRQTEPKYVPSVEALSKEATTPVKLKNQNENVEKEEVLKSRNRGSGDWLGLKDQENGGDFSLFPESTTRSKTAEPSTAKKETKLPPKPATARKRVNILDDLFGDSAFTKKPEPQSSGILDLTPEIKTADETKYTPSLSTGRKLEKRKDSTTLGLGFDTDIDWVLGPKPTATPIADKPDISAQFSNKEAPRRLSNVESPTVFKNVESPAVFKNPETPTIFKRPESPAKYEQPRKKSLDVPEWLGGGKEEPVPVPEEKPPEPKSDFIDLLGNIKEQFGFAMERHSQNLQNYMQLLLNEAQRMSFAEQLINPAKTIQNQNDSTKNQKNQKEEEYLETIKYQEDQIHDLEVKISRLEIQIDQLNLKIENLENIKNIEIENIKQAHQFEVKNMENRLDRSKSTYEEIIEELEKKISKLKKNEEELEHQYKEKLVKLQSEKMEELNQIKEYHKFLSLEHKTNISINDLQKYSKPVDDIEISDREMTLIEKEKQIEILKSELTVQKRNLDEAMEKEKAMREERERESRRLLMEVKFKEEVANREIERKKEQLDVQEKQIEEMRMQALKEQMEISKEKLTVAAEKARMEATMKIERNQDAPLLQPLDMAKARLEMEVALEAVKEAREAADDERRRNAEMRKVAEEITWEQKNKDQQLEMRERHINNLLKDAEITKEEGLESFRKAEIIRKAVEEKEKELRAMVMDIENKEKGLAKERLEIAKERMELERQKSLLEAFLPTLKPDEELMVNPPKFEDDKGYVDPKVLIMRLRAEKDLGSFITHHRP